MEVQFRPNNRWYLVNFARSRRWYFELTSPILFPGDQTGPGLVPLSRTMLQLAEAAAIARDSRTGQCAFLSLHHSSRKPAGGFHKTFDVCLRCCWLPL